MVEVQEAHLLGPYNPANTAIATVAAAITASDEIAEHDGEFLVVAASENRGFYVICLASWEE
jgi:hypothetical protein